MNLKRIRFLSLTCGLVLLVGQTYGHSLAPMLTSKRITSPELFSTAKIGDILTFTIQVTPFPNNATQGTSAYITEYIPGNTEVVGVRFTDRNGNTVVPNRGPRMDDGFGPKGRHNEFDGLGLLQGSMSAIYSDTGVFFSLDPRTARVPNDTDLTVFSGIEIGLSPTGAGQIDQEYGVTGPPYYAHNEWDRTQVLAFGVSGGTVGGDGRGNTPFGFGSPVAGPETHYPFDVVDTPACSDGLDNDVDLDTDYPADAECSSALDNDETASSDAPIGPWQRINNWGSEIGTGSSTDCTNCASDYVRVGVPTALGWSLSSDNPLPANTNAVRFSIGETILGHEYFAEISLRVTGLPVDPVMDSNVNCAEVFGGDAAMPQNGQDNAWRYFLPSPACAHLDLVFDLEVDKIFASTGDVITYTLSGKNLSEVTQTNVVITDNFVPGELTFIGMLQGGSPSVEAGLLTWPGMSLSPNEGYVFQWQMQVVNDQGVTLNRADYNSDALSPPGYSAVALTTIEPFVLLAQEAAVDGTSTSAGSDVRYTITLTNSGTGQAALDGGSYIHISLPADFSYCAPSFCDAPTINAVDIPNPTINGGFLTFSTGLVPIPPNGGTLILEFSGEVGGSVPPGQYTINVRSQFDDSSMGRNVEASNDGLAPLLVDVSRTDAPALYDSRAGSNHVTGWSSEGEGTQVNIFLNGNPAGSSFTDFAGEFDVDVGAALYLGQRVSASAQAAGEIESDRIPEVSVIADYCNVKTESGVKASLDFFYEACDSLIIDSSFIAQDSASIFLSSGKEIDFLPGFTIEQGSTLSANVCGQSLCAISASPMPDGCHSCVDQICDIDPACCDTEFDQACLDKVYDVCDLICE